MKAKKMVCYFSATLIVMLFQVFCITTAIAKEPIKWKAVSSWSKEYVNTRYFLIPWVEKINKELAGEIEVSWVGPESIPPFEQLQPVKTGIVDILSTHSAYHSGEVAICMAMDLFNASSKERRDAGFYKIMDDIYREKANMHFLGAGCDNTGYHLMLRKKCINSADLSGLKVRTSPFYDPFITTLNGAPVRVAGGEIYSALEKGVVDGACWPAFGALDYKWYEVCEYQIRPRFGETVHPFLINLDSWNKLSKELQDKVTKITMEVEEESRIKLTEAWKKEENELVELGMKLCDLPKEEKEIFSNTFYEETWKLVLKLDPKNGEKLKEAVDKFLEERNN